MREDTNRIEQINDILTRLGGVKTHFRILSADADFFERYSLHDHAKWRFAFIVDELRAIIAELREGGIAESVLRDAEKYLDSELDRVGLDRAELAEIAATHDPPPPLKSWKDLPNDTP